MAGRLLFFKLSFQTYFTRIAATGFIPRNYELDNTISLNYFFFSRPIKISVSKTSEFRLTLNYSRVFFLSRCECRTQTRSRYSMNIEQTTIIYQYDFKINKTSPVTLTNIALFRMYMHDHIIWCTRKNTISYFSVLVTTVYA